MLQGRAAVGLAVNEEWSIITISGTRHEKGGVRRSMPCCGRRSEDVASVTRRHIGQVGRIARGGDGRVTGRLYAVEKKCLLQIYDHGYARV